MRIAVFAYSRQGCRTARKILSLYPGDEVKAFTMERFDEEGFGFIAHPSKLFYGELFSWANALIFVGSCGIAIREIAPHVRDKRSDPAVVCVDELGRYSISLLSGHIGGANGVASAIASGIGAIPVITTATDINERFSVDSWAARNGFAICDIRCAKAVSAAILERDIPLSCDFDIVSDLPNGLVLSEEGELGICVSFRTNEPFDRTLRVVPKVLHVGIGCRRGACASLVRTAVETVLRENDLDPSSVKCVASIDLKANEEGLLQYCRDIGVMPDFYSSADLMAVSGKFAVSEFVRNVTGVDTVCERAALIGADRLIVGKTIVDGVTVAIAAESLEVCFE